MSVEPGTPAPGLNLEGFFIVVPPVPTIQTIRAQMEHEALNPAYDKDGILKIPRPSNCFILFLSSYKKHPAVQEAFPSGRQVALSKNASASWDYVKQFRGSSLALSSPASAVATGSNNVEASQGSTVVDNNYRPLLEAWKTLATQVLAEHQRIYPDYKYQPVSKVEKEERNIRRLQAQASRPALKVRLVF